MLHLRPLSILGPRIPQFISWFYDPNDYTEPFLKKIEKVRPVIPYFYSPPAYKPSMIVKEGAKKLS